MSAAALARDLRRALAAVAEPQRAAPMQAYAKSSMPCLGVTAVPLRRVCREMFAESTFPTAAAWRRAALLLWRGARFREELTVAGFRGPMLRTPLDKMAV